MNRQRRTTLLMVLFASVIVGIGLAKKSLSPMPVGWVWLSLPFLVVAFVSRLRWLPIVCLIFFGVCIGWWRGGIVGKQINSYENLFGKKVILEVKADSDGAYTDKSQMIFDASHIRLIEPEERALVGRVTIAGFGTHDIRRGDTVEVEGKLSPTIGGKQARMSFAQMKIKARSASIVEKVRRKFLASLRTVLPEPQASFGLGLLIGQTRELPQSYVDVLRIVGLSHIIAVSGYNLTIVADIFSKKVRKRSKFRGMVMTLGLIAAFVLLAGTSASIARAAQVSVLSVIAGYYGRKVKPLLLILLVAGYSAFVNPLNVWGDVGWYLSFLAFFGILVVAPAIQKRFWKDKEPKGYAALIIESFSAQIMTIPYVMFVFSQLSVVSLLSNLIVLPLIPMAMLLTAVAGMAGIFLPIGLALLVAWPASLLLRAILDVSVLFSRIPNASVKVGISVIIMTLMYSLLIAGVLLLKNFYLRRTEAVVK